MLFKKRLTPSQQLVNAAIACDLNALNSQLAVGATRRRVILRDFRPLPLLRAAAGPRASPPLSHLGRIRHNMSVAQNQSRFVDRFFTSRRLTGRLRPRGFC
jgi:hypothetical protein